MRLNRVSLHLKAKVESKGHFFHAAWMKFVYITIIVSANELITDAVDFIYIKHSDIAEGTALYCFKTLYNTLCSKKIL